MDELLDYLYVEYSDVVKVLCSGTLRLLYVPVL